MRLELVIEIILVIVIVIVNYPTLSVFTRGHSLCDVADSKDFQTLRSNFSGIYIKNFPTALLRRGLLPRTTV